MTALLDCLAVPGLQTVVPPEWPVEQAVSVWSELRAEERRVFVRVAGMGVAELSLDAVRVAFSYSRVELYVGMSHDELADALVDGIAGTGLDMVQAGAELLRLARETSTGRVAMWAVHALVQALADLTHEAVAA